MEFKTEVLTCQYRIVSFFVNHLAYAKGLEAAKPRIKNHHAFWAVTIESHLELAVIEWCKVFGSPRNEALHWTKTPIGNTAEEARTDFPSRVLTKTGFTQERWEAYQQEMLVFRDKFVAHLDLNGVMEYGKPLVEPALQVAYAYEEWAKAIEPALTEHGSLRLRYEDLKAEATSVASLYHHP